MFNWLLPLFIATSAPTWAKPSCFPSVTAAQILWDLSRSPQQSPVVWPLKGERDGTIVETRAQLVAENLGSGSVSLKVRFDPEFDGVSLPYNVYAVIVVADGDVVYWHDFTNACQGPGIGFFPGREVVLPPVKLVGGGRDRLQIMVWGKL